MAGQKISGPTRDESPCKTCTDERYTACHDTCEKIKPWLAEVERVNKNRREYARQCDVQWKKK